MGVFGGCGEIFEWYYFLMSHDKYIGFMDIVRLFIKYYIMVGLR